MKVAGKKNPNMALRTLSGELNGPPWHNRLEACQVVAFLAFISGCGVAEGGRARLAEQSRAGGILQGEGRREREGVNKLNTGEKGKREREDVGSKTMEAHPSLTPCLLPCTVDWREVLRCEHTRRKRETGNNMEVMFV